MNVKSVRVWWTGLACLFLEGLVECAFSSPQTEADAANAARGWLRNTAMPLESRRARQVNAITTWRNQIGDTLYHVVSLDPEGYLLVAADSEVEPILGFSCHGRFAADSDNPLVTFLALDLAARIQRAQQDRRLSGAGPRPAIAKWDRLKRLAEGQVSRLSTSGSGLPAMDEWRVAPLIQSRWDQGAIWEGTNLVACFNYYTPPYDAGTSSNYVCGCNSTAWAQIMRYFQYPTQSVGTGTFKIKVDGVPQTWKLRGGDGQGGPYAWSLMPLAPGAGISLTERQAIGALTADIGAVSATEYNTNGSGAYLDSTNLLGVFHYSNAILGSKLDSQFTNRVHPNLDAGNPVFLSLSGDSDHGLVCDGYGYSQSTLYHHLNFGWSGSQDAWYNLPNVETEWGHFTNVTWYYFNIFTNGSGEIISGRITDANNFPLPNAVVQALGGGQTRTAISNGRGIYALSRLPSNTAFALTVSREGFSFTPRTTATLKSDVYGGVGNQWGVNFMGSLNTNLQLVCGTVTRLDGSGIAEVVLTFSNGAGKATTDVSGVYLKTVPKGWTGAITPAGTQLIFDPLSRSCSNFSGNLTGQDFRATVVFFVRSDAMGLNDGTSWPNAFTNLQTAIARSSAGAAIWVAQGTYYPGPNRTNMFLCPAAVPLYGGFAGTETTHAQRDWEAHPTILSGDIGIPGDIQDNSYHVVKGVNGARLDGFTITSGNANHPSAWDQQQGGGIYCDWWSTTNFVAQNCRITGNVARETGGGGYAGAYVNCTIVSNTARLGGGLCMGTTTNCLFQSNVAAGGGGAYSATNYGGRFYFNNATNLGGGGMASRFDGCLLFSNVSSSAGGGYSHSWAANCLVFRNTTGSYGGGAHLSTNVNCTVTENIAALGGGLNEGMAINSIVWNNVATYQSNNYCNTLLRYSCSLPCPPGTGNITNSPLFLDAANGDYRPAPESLCVNTGQNQPWMTDATDLAGRPRIHNLQVDMGAYELEVTQPSLACSTATLSFVSPAGETAVPSQILEVWNSGIGTLNYVLTTNAAWILPSPASGSSTGELNRITVQVSRAGLGEGLYTGVIAVQSTNALVSQRTVNVSLRLLPDYNGSLDTSGWVWMSEGDALWRPQTSMSHDGVDAVCSGIITPGQSSLLRTSLTGPGLLTFWWRVSSPAGTGLLKFLLDTQAVAQISGEAAWQKFSLSMPEGLHSVQWSYSKDSAGASGQDTAWLDQVMFVAAPSVIQAQRTTNGSFRLSIQTVSGQSYFLEYKNTLTNGTWISLPATAGEGTIQQLIDPDATAAQRFYRVRME